MSAMEKSLRRALEAGDASNPAFRDTIYTASERALERMLANSTDPDAAHAQRVRLAETINRIEEDYFVAEADGDDWTSAPDPDAEHAAEADYGTPEHVPATDLPHEDERTDETALSDEHMPAAADADADAAGMNEASAARAGATSPKDDWSPGVSRRETGSRSGRSLKPLLLALAVILAVLFAGLYFLQSALFGGISDAASTSTEGSAGAATVDTASWINLFDGTQLELISTPTGGNVVAVTGSGDRPAVRLEAAGEGGEVGLVVGPGVVNTIKGHKVRVEITAGSSDGQSREFGIRCLFGGDTVCDRQRFTTMQDSQPFVFDMTVPDNPAASGSLAIDPSLGPGKGDVDLYGVRLRDLGKA